METAILINEMDETIHIVEIVVQDGENCPMEFITVDSNPEEFAAAELANNANKRKMITQEGEGSNANTSHVEEIIVSPDFNEDDGSVVVEQQTDHYDDNDDENENDQLQEIIVPKKRCANCSELLVSSTHKSGDGDNNIKEEEEDDDDNDDEASLDGENQQNQKLKKKDRQEVYEIEYSTPTSENDFEQDPITSFLQKNNIETDPNDDDNDVNKDSEDNRKKDNSNESSVKTVKVQNILSSVYKLGYLNTLLNFDQKRDRSRNRNDSNNTEEVIRFDDEIPICGRCAHSLASLYRFYTEFNQLRQTDSYLSTRIARLDKILENQINFIARESLKSKTTSKTISSKKSGRGNKISSSRSPIFARKSNMKNTSNLQTTTKPGGKKRGRKRKTSVSEYTYRDQNKKMSSYLQSRSYNNRNIASVRTIEKIPESPLNPVPFVKLIKLEETPEIAAAAAALSAASNGPSNYGLRRNRRIKKEDPDFVHDLDSVSDEEEEEEDYRDNGDDDDSDGDNDVELPDVPDDYLPSGASEEDEGGDPDEENKSEPDENHKYSEPSSAKRKRKVGRKGEPRKIGRKVKEEREEKVQKVKNRTKKIKKRKKFVPEDPLTLDCIICGNLMGSSRELTEHYMTHVDAVNSLVCPVCVHNSKTKPRSEVWTGIGSMNKPFLKKSTLLLHLRLHSGEKPLSCPVYGCQQAFVRKNDLKRHVATHDVPPEVRLKPYNCPVCPRSFETAQILKIHVRRHTGDKPYSCSVCHKSFVQSGNLKQHFKTHTGEKPHLCSHCGKAFAAASALERHVRIHTGELPYQCEICLRAFRVHTALTRHAIIHTGQKKFLCPYCGKAFTLNETLKRHIQTHTGARPYQCMVPGCTQSFPDNRPLKRHMLTHGAQATIARKSTPTTNTLTTTMASEGGGPQLIEFVFSPNMSVISEEVVL